VAAPVVPAADVVRQPLSLRASWAWFTLGVVAFVPLLGWYASAAHGSMGWISAASAGALCWAAGLAALAIVARTRGPNAVSGLLLAMMVRLGGPLVVGIVIDSRGGALAEAGFFQLVVWMYLATLAVETWLMVRMVPATGSGSAGGKSAGGGSARAPHTPKTGESSAAGA
jgi:hypothetical protein